MMWWRMVCWRVVEDGGGVVEGDGAIVDGGHGVVEDGGGVVEMMVVWWRELVVW